VFPPAYGFQDHAHLARVLFGSRRAKPGSAGDRVRSEICPLAAVTFYFAQDCSLCVPVHELLERLRGELGFALEEVDVTGVPELEKRYRAWLPVVEIDGRRAFVFAVDEDELRERLGAPGGPGPAA